MVKDEKLFLIGGTGQNVGKTSFAIDIISSNSKNHKIIAIKTSNHFHGIIPTDIIIEHNSNFTIVKETTTNTGKDSARMLKAGASEVYFIQAKDQYLFEAYQYLSNTIDKDSLIICETAALRNYIIPKVFIAMSNSSTKAIPDNKKILEKADLIINDYLDKKDNRLYICIDNNNKWKLK